MVELQEPCTRKKIIEVATKLFSKKSYKGTSVRDISALANVNIASINYHFKSKENLLFEVLKNGCRELKAQIDSIPIQEKTTTADFCIKIFNVLLNNQNIILNNMKLLLSEEAKQMEDHGLEDEIYGPPGGAKLVEVIKQSIQKPLKNEDATWAVQTIFSVIYHQALILSSPYTHRKEIQSIFNEKLAKKRLRRTVEMIERSLVSL